MVRPLLWPFTGRWITKDGYIKILHKFVNHCADAKYHILTMYALKYILKCNWQIKSLWFIQVYNPSYCTSPRMGSVKELCLFMGLSFRYRNSSLKLVLLLRCIIWNTLCYIARRTKFGIFTDVDSLDQKNKAPCVYIYIMLEVTF